MEKMSANLRILISFSLSRILISASSFETDSPFFAAPIQNTTARLSDDARLACIVENLGPYQVAWFHQASGAVLTVGKTVLTSNTRISVSREQRNTWVLGINNVTRSDAGQYMCQVSTSPPRKLFGHLSIVAPTHRGSKLLLNEVSPKTSGSFVCVASNGHPPSVSRVLSLKVIHSPRVEFMSGKDTLWVARGDTVTLSCRYTAYPLPRVVFHVENFQRLHNWSHTHFEIKPLRHQFPFTHVMTLTIPRITSFDFGNHSCIVRNEEGEAYDSIMVRETFTTTSSTAVLTTTTPTTIVADHELEGRGPIPLRDGSFTSSENNSFPLGSQSPAPSEEATRRIKVKKKTVSISTTEAPWSKKIARINLSDSVKSNVGSVETGRIIFVGIFLRFLLCNI